MQIKAYYFGEFGYFNFIILGRLQEYFLTHDSVLEVATYPDYYSVLKHVFGDRIVPSDVSVTLTSEERDSLRCYHTNRAVANFPGHVALPTLLDAEVKDWTEGRRKITLLKQPILHPRRTGERFVSVSMRNRIMDPARNMSEENWRRAVDTIRKVPRYRDCKIIVHGLRAESLNMDIENSVFCEDIIESIFYLNHSWFFLASMSGFGQFASNCNCNLLQIGSEHQMIDYNPFNKTNICITGMSDIGSSIHPARLNLII